MLKFCRVPHVLHELANPPPPHRNLERLAYLVHNLENKEVLFPCCPDFLKATGSLVIVLKLMFKYKLIFNVYLLTKGSMHVFYGC